MKSGNQEDGEDTEARKGELKSMVSQRNPCPLWLALFAAWSKRNFDQNMDANPIGSEGRYGNFHARMT
jgi:hypothetical protein